MVHLRALRVDLVGFLAVIAAVLTVAAHSAAATSFETLAPSCNAARLAATTRGKGVQQIFHCLDAVWGVPDYFNSIWRHGPAILLKIMYLHSTACCLVPDT